MLPRVPDRESLTIEFKSDRNKLKDDALARAAVCLANAEGGQIYLGVENDGRATGLHMDRPNGQSLAGIIANQTLPPLSVRIESLSKGNKQVAVVSVPKSDRIVATSGGTVLRRRLQANGMPQCVPFLPAEFVSRASDLRKVDYSAFTVDGSSLDDLNPVERVRLRDAIQEYRGEESLLRLSDEELDGALGLTTTVGDLRLPTVAGLLLVGKESALRRHLPTHEVALQHLDGTDVRANDFYRWPLVRLYEQIEQFYQARVMEEEIQVGFFRVPVPSLSSQAFRECVVNALTHRDYAKLGAVHIRWTSECVTVSNPGGFVDGVRLDNLLVTEPRPRNPVLADAFKRIGMAERTGRGVDRIYEWLLRYGRPQPDYTRSDSTSVVAELSCTPADLEFLKMVMQEEKRLGTSMPIDNLLALSHLRVVRRTDSQAVATVLQKDLPRARGILEHLVEIGLVRALGTKTGRGYVLSPEVYKRTRKPEHYTRLAGFNKLQHTQMILGFIADNKTIRRANVIDLCMLSAPQATRLLSTLVDEGVLKREGRGRGSYYLQVT